jgi:hypothetical protein
MSHNGWINRTTWIAYSWLTNDETMYQALRDIALSPQSYAGHLRQKGEDLKQYMFKVALGKDSPISSAGLVADLVNDALSDIDYVAIIEAVEL